MCYVVALSVALSVAAQVEVGIADVIDPPQFTQMWKLKMELKVDGVNRRVTVFTKRVADDKIVAAYNIPIKSWKNL